MKSVLAVLFLLFFSSNLFCQHLVRSTIGCLGNSNTMGGILIRQSVGQPSLTTVEQTGGIVLRQGFQQPVNSITKDSIVRGKSVDRDLYPNPNGGMFKIVVRGDHCLAYKYSLVDGSGRVLDGGLLIAGEEKDLECENCAAGMYYLQLFCSGAMVGIEKVIIL
jgi:hypothetical protein